MANQSPSKKNSKSSKRQKPYASSPMPSIKIAAQKSRTRNMSESPYSPSTRKATRNQGNNIGYEVSSAPRQQSSLHHTKTRVMSPNSEIVHVIAQNAVTASDPMSELTDCDGDSSIIGEILEQDDAAATAETLIVDSFRIKVDRSSVETIRKLVDDLNCCIDHAVMNILEAIKSLSYGMHRKRNPNGPSTNEMGLTLDIKGISSLEELLNLLDSPYELKESSRARILDLIMHDHLCNLIYDAYFHGKYFWGFQKERNSYNDKLYDTVIKQEPDVARKWRSITINAQFEIHKGDIEEITKKIVHGFKGIITKAFCHNTSDRQNDKAVKVVSNHQKLIREIVKRSHSLSLQIQRDMLLSSLQIVRFTPSTQRKKPRLYRKGEMTRVSEVDAPSQDGDTVLGMFRLGLVMGKEGKEESEKFKRLIKPVIITNSDVEWALKTDD